MFNNNSSGYSLSDVAAVTRGNNDGFGFGDGNGAWWVILLFIFAFGGWGGGFGGWGNNGGGQGAVTAAMDTDYLSTGVRDLQHAVSDDFYALNTGMLNGFCNTQNAIANSTASITGAVTNGFNTQNLANLQNTNAIQRDIYAGTVGAMQNTQALQATLAQMSSNNRADTAQIAYNQATDTCAINTNASNNTRDIIDAINNGNQMLANMMQQNKFDAMQDRIAELQSQVQAKDLAAFQAAQNAYLIDQLRPCPTPSYNVPNPFCGCGGNYNSFNNMANI